MSNLYSQRIFPRLLLLVILVSCLGRISIAQSQNDWIQEHDFVYLDTIMSDAIYDVRYAGHYNFIGKPVKGYQTQRLVFTNKAAKALKKAEHLFKELGFGLKIFDTYRPKRAVEHFKQWAKNPADTIMKNIFYPDLNKKYLFNKGYISSRSGHSRGSTIDLTLYYLDNLIEVDMGGPYDYFGERSHHTFQQLSTSQLKYRALLKSILSRCGFRSYEKEWWHYTLRREPYPKTYFDFVVPR